MTNSASDEGKDIATPNKDAEKTSLSMVERLLSHDGLNAVKTKNNGLIGISILALGILGDLVTLFGPWIVLAATLCGMAIAVFMLIAVLKPKWRAACAVPFVSVIMMFSVSLVVLIGQYITGAQEQGMLAKHSPQISNWQEGIGTRIGVLDKKLGRIEDKIDQIGEQTYPKGHYITEIGDAYPRYLAKILFNSDVPEEQWPAEISLALERYALGKQQLSQAVGLSLELEKKRKRALKLYEHAKLDEAEILLQEIEATTVTSYEKTARDRAVILGDRAAIASARLDHLQAIELYEQAAQTVLSFDKGLALQWLVSGADLARERGMGFADHASLYRSIALYKSALTYVSHTDGMPLAGQEKVWAVAKINLGITYQALGEAGKSGELQIAIKIYNEALTALSREKTPLLWGRAHSNLGNAYLRLGERGDPKSLKLALGTYEAALEVITLENAAYDWAKIKNNMSHLHYLFGQAGNKTELNAAQSSADAALGVFTFEKHPAEWATAKTNRGNVYFTLAQLGDRKALDSALADYQDTLKVFSRNDHPLQWANTQNNIGNIYVYLYQYGDKKAPKMALTAYEHALLERTREKVPYQWAMTKSNLGALYLSLGRAGNGEALGEAIRTFEDVLMVYTYEKTPFQWASTIENLGYALWAKGETLQAEKNLRSALEIYRALSKAYYVTTLEEQMRKFGLEP